MDSTAFRQHGHALVEWIAQYLEHPENYPVLSQIKPGQIIGALPAQPPEEPEPFADILADFERVLVPGLTHWNNPSFFAYFAITASWPGILAEFLSAALNQQAMLWRTSPAATELESVSLSWLRQLIGLSSDFEGVIYDTASIATLHALAAAREAVPQVRAKGLAGRSDVPSLRVYCSEEAHSSVEKAAIAVGLGSESVEKIPVDDEFRMRPDLLEHAIENDRQAGRFPMAVVATVGTTSTTSVDPVAAIAEICGRQNIWLHVDAAYGGSAAILPSHAHVLDGASRADSLVINPHKWLFVPFDLSAFYCRRMDSVRRAFSLTPDYLQTAEGGEARNLMDTGVQLGRRFRALKLWFVLRAFGARGIREHLARHIELARQLASWIDAHPRFERLAPVPFSVVCFRWRPDDAASETEIDVANLRLLNEVNATGTVFLSHTRIRGRVALRIAIGHMDTSEVHVRKAWDLLCELTRRPPSSGGGGTSSVDEP